jgi:predicted nucleic acid-binding protein
MPARVVLDASIAVRAAVAHDSPAIAWCERVHGRTVDAAWPELVFAEVANAVSRYVAARAVEPLDGAAAVDFALAIPALRVPLADLVRPAYRIALDRSISVYDACYVALAEARGALLVTSDGKLAAATANAELI